MRWLERRRRERRIRREKKTFAHALGERTPETIAETVAASHLADRIATDDKRKLARAIGKLSERDRYLLAATAEGQTPLDIASAFFLPLSNTTKDIKRIVTQLAGDGGSNTKAGRS